MPAARAMLMVSKPVHGRTDVEGSVDHMRDAQRPSDFLVLNPVKGAADAASALRAIGIASEDAGLDVRFKIGGVVG